jgi:nucleoid DNA-binding protein
LKPTKAKEFIPQVANESNLPEDAVTAIVNFYWQEVRKSLSGFMHSRIHITNLGDFVIKYRKLENKINKLENFEEYNRQKGLQQMTSRFKTVETLYNLKALKVIMEEEEQRKNFIKIHKNTGYVHKEQPDQNLEEQEPNT